jgi:hypothetical protein
MIENDVGKSASNITAVRKAFKDAYSHLLQLTLVDKNTLGPIVSVSQQV